MVDVVLDNGTTTAMYYETIHHDSSVVLVKICLKKRQRALVGIVAMSLPDQYPDFYRDDFTQYSIEHIEAFIHAVNILSSHANKLAYTVVMLH